MLNMLDIISAVLLSLKITGNADNINWLTVFIPVIISCIAEVIHKNKLKRR